MRLSVEPCEVPLNGRWRKLVNPRSTWLVGINSHWVRPKACREPLGEATGSLGTSGTGSSLELIGIENPWLGLEDRCMLIGTRIPLKLIKTKSPWPGLRALVYVDRDWKPFGTDRD
ncbi:hypothetical protein BHE74_00015053 [Ensete ventricosum]|uniref:Uncharacterized protein n=1 Tax=Ensete ventricosum TaxID=4639 RepID=A0A445MHZ1_ENSVE|nr:hypothetical protein BHE74_00015053 [Ensete ventricosum]RZR73885.1 hypothetical protein BHM03_00029233 [Ensete ventricosum]